MTISENKKCGYQEPAITKFVEIRPYCQIYIFSFEKEDIPWPLHHAMHRVILLTKVRHSPIAKYVSTFVMQLQCQHILIYTLFSTYHADTILYY